MLKDKKLQLLFLTAVVFAAYSPSIFAEILRLDDDTMLEYIRRNNHWGFKEIFVPGGTNWLYYRPILVLSFLIDKSLFDLSTPLMHLHNIGIHVVNAILIYLIASHIAFQGNRNQGYFPLVASLCFGLHPLTTESVSWLSGRTDILGGFFVFLSALLLLKYRSRPGTEGYMVLSIISLVLGMLTKEVAVAFLPGALLLLVASRQTIPDMTDNDALGTRRSRRTVAFFVLGAIFAVLFYYGLRTLAATPHPRLKLTLLIMQTNIQHIVRTSLEALGFYMKKIFMPYPLNLAILEVDPLYQLLGIPIFLVCIYLILRRTLMSALFMCGVFLITPSFVIALKQIAWTPYAERYLYIPLGFILVSTLYYLHRNLEFPSAVFKRTAVIGLIGAMCIYSVTRNFTWQSNIRLCEDTLEKSPTCKELLMVYGGLLDDRGEYEKALAQFRRAASLRGIGYDERPDIYAAEILERRGDIDEAYAVYREVLERSKGKSRKALARVVSILEGRTERVLSEKERLQAMKELHQYSITLFELTKDPRVLYKLGNISMALKNKKEAFEYFTRAYSELPENDTYRQYCKRELETLSREFSN